MKGNKKILLIAILLFMLSVSFASYAIYRSSATANGTIKAAGWSVQVNGDDISSTNLTFDWSNITWTTHTGKNNTIAPGDSGYITIPVDATGSEVDVLLTAQLGSVTLPDGMTVSLANGSDSQTIYYDDTSMEADVDINITWSGATTDTTGKDTTDKTAAGSNISIPVTLTARQKLSTD